MALKLITSAAEKLVSLTEAKSFCRVDGTDQDDVMNILIDAAIEAVGKICNRSFGITTWELVLDEFPEDAIMLPIAPLNTVESVKYFDVDGNEITLSTDDYYVDADSEPGWVVPMEEGWPDTMAQVNAVHVRFTAGYSGMDDSPPTPETNVPATLKLAVLQLISHWNEVREPASVGNIVTEVPMTYELLIARHRIYL